MPTYKIWHGECDSYDEAETIEASDPFDATRDTIFVYSAGDCDRGATKIATAKHGRFIATRENSDDYFFIEEQDAKETDQGLPR